MLFGWSPLKRNTYVFAWLREGMVPVSVPQACYFALRGESTIVSYMIRRSTEGALEFFCFLLRCNGVSAGTNICFFEICVSSRRCRCRHSSPSTQMPLNGPQLAEQGAVFNKNFFTDFKVSGAGKRTGGGHTRAMLVVLLLS